MQITAIDPVDRNVQRSGHPAEPLRVLLVDDETQVRSALARTLRDEPYELLTADSGQRALEIIDRTSVQVVVSDMGMPGMDGIRLLAEVADRSPHTVRMVLSGQSDAKLILDAVNSGRIYQYILKPWDNSQLRIIVRQALALWNLQDERNRLLAALQQHNSQLEEMVAQRTRQILAVERQADIGRYASQIVHNLNNPLHSVSAALEWLEMIAAGDPPDRKKLAKGLGIARGAADDLKAIIAGILNHTGESAYFSMVNFEINALIEKEMVFFEMFPDFKYKIEKRLMLDNTIGPIRGNPLQIKQVLDNLIKNALDAMEEAPVRQLTVQTAAEKDHVVIRIGDTGHGILPEHMERIFASDFTTKPVDKGTGLGLASVKAMVDAYSGTIRIDSQPGRGTTFTIRLPAMPTAAAAAHTMERAAS